MDLYKIVHFNHESDGVPFPWFYAMDEEESRQIRLAFAQQLGLIERLPDDAEIARALDAWLNLQPAVNANETAFDLAGILGAFGIMPMRNVYLDWAEDEDRFGATIDEIRFADFSMQFPMIWYPDLDDLLLFDDSYSWACHITLAGDIKLGKITPASA